MSIADGITALVALGGLVLTWYQYRASDRQAVTEGSADTGSHQGGFMKVQNVSTHDVELQDMGFIEATGEKFSLLAEVDHTFGEDDDVGHGATKLKAREVTSGRAFRPQKRFIGAYAQSLAQSRPTIYLFQRTGLLMGLCVRLELRHPRLYALFCRPRFGRPREVETEL